MVERRMKRFYLFAGICLLLVFILAGKSKARSCGETNGRKTRELMGECSDDGKTFDSWIRSYPTSNDLYKQYEPCQGTLNEVRVKQVIQFCYCYNFCGSGQSRNGCVVEGLEGRLDLGANLFSSYKANCRIDCTPTDKLQKIASLKNELSEGTVTQVISITEGTSSIKTTESGGSFSTSVTGKVGLNLKKVFTAELSVSATTGYNWGQSSTTSFSRDVKHEARIPVPPTKTVSVYQVTGECNTSDDTLYTVNTKSLVVRENPANEENDEQGSTKEFLTL